MDKIKIIFVCLFVCLSLQAQKKHYVKPNGFVSTTTSSWSRSSNDLQGVIDIASPGDIVYVAAGVYNGGFLMKDGVSVKGGYTANPDDPDERFDPTQTDDLKKQSILDGTHTQRVVTQFLPFVHPTVWDGFVIRNGKPSDNLEGSIIYAADGSSEIAGILYKYDPEEKQGMMVSREEVKIQWGGYREVLPELPVVADGVEAASDLNSTSEAIVESLQENSLDFSESDLQYNGNYAAYWCDTLTFCGYSDWCLPSSGEFREIFEAGINTQLKGLDKNLTAVYWTASQVGDALAWTYSFNKNDFHPSLKYVKHAVMAVHAVDISDSEPSLQSAGGGVFLLANGILQNSIVTGNSSSFRGGGVYVGGGGALQDCIVEGNQAPEGPQVYYEWPVQISETPVMQVFRVFPTFSRAGESVMLEIYAPFTNANYRIHDLSGKYIRGGEVKGSQTVLSLSALKGNYIVTIQLDNTSYNQKIIIY